MAQTGTRQRNSLYTQKNMRGLTAAGGFSADGGWVAGLAKGLRGAWLACLLLPHPVHAGVERLNLQFVYGNWYQAPLRWDRADVRPWLRARPSEGSAEWVIRLPADSWLRVREPDKSDCLKGLEIHQGDGSGLFAQVEPYCDTSGANLLLPDEQGQDRMVRLRRPGRDLAQLEIYVSRRESRGSLTPNREVVPLTGPHWLVRSQDGQLDRYVQVGPGQSSAATIQGPARVQLMSRLYYPHGPGKGPRLATARPAECGLVETRLAEPAPWSGPLVLPRNVDQYEIDLSLTALEKPNRAPAPASRCEARQRCGERSRVWRQRLLVDSAPEIAAPVRIHGCRVLTAQLEQRYFDVPPGLHRLQVHSESYLLLRLQQWSSKAYLLPQLNGPKPDAESLRTWVQEGQAHAGSLDLSLFARAEEAERWLRDNTTGAGALRAIESLRQTPEQVPGHAQALRLAGKIEARHSYFRSLNPADPGRGARSYFAQVLPRRLIPSLQSRGPAQVHPAQLDALMQALSAAHFVQPAARCSLGQFCAATPADRTISKMQELHFALPSRGADSDLEVLIDTRRINAPVSFWLQYDQSTPRRMTVYPRPDEAEGGQMPGHAELALQLRSAMGHSGLSGAGPHHLLVPARARMALPQAVRNARIWSEDPGSLQLGFALRYRVAKAFSLSPEQYLERVARWPGGAQLEAVLRLLSGRLPKDEQWFVPVGGFLRLEDMQQQAEQLGARGGRLQRQLRRDSAGGQTWWMDVGPFPTREAAEAFLSLNSDLLPLAKVRVATAGLDYPEPGSEPSSGSRPSDWAELVQHWLPMINVIRDRRQRFFQGLGQPGPLGVRGDLARALSLRAAGDDVRALEVLGDLRLLEDADQRTRGLTLLWNLLIDQGERGTAERLIRGWLRDDPDSGVRRRASTLLEGLYRDEVNPLALQGLYAVQLGQDGFQAARAAANLVRQWVQDGLLSEALWLGLLLPACERPDEALLQASYELKHWSVFHSLLGSAEPSVAALWQGFYSQGQGHFDAAIAAWRAAGERGQALIAALGLGIELQRALSSASAAVRLGAIDAWANWQVEQPVPRRWMLWHEAVTRHDGMLSVEVLSRDKLLEAYRLSPGRTMELRIEGPAKLLLEVRPVFPQGHSGEFSGWLHIEHNGQNKRLPVYENRVIPGLRPLEEDSRLGQAERSYLEFGSGTHRLRISQPEQAFVVRPMQLQAATPLLSVPQFSTETLADAISGQWRDPGLPPGSSASAGGARVFKGCSSQALQPLAHRRMPEQQTRPRTHCPDCRTGPRPSSHRLVPKPAFAFPPVDVDPEPDINVIDIADAALRREALIRALWRAETQPAQAAQWARYATALRLQHERLPDDQALFGRISPFLSWETLATPAQSAGYRREVLAGWNPESEHLRVRRALLPVTRHSEHVLQPGERLNLNIRQAQSSELPIQLRALELPYSAEAPMQLAVFLDEALIRRISLSGGAPESLRIRLPAGPRQLRVQFERGFANQFLAVDLGSAVAAPEKIRDWHISLPGEVVRWRANPSELFLVESPGRVPTVRYATKQAGEFRLDDPHHQRAWRIRQLHLRTFARQRFPVRHTPLGVQLAELEPWPKAGVNGQRLVLTDSIPLGRQQAGSVALRVSRYDLRFNSENADPAPRQYSQVGLLQRRELEVWTGRAGLDLYQRSFDAGFASQWLDYFVQWQHGPTPWTWRIANSWGYQTGSQELWTLNAQLGLSYGWRFGEQHGGRLRGTFFQARVEDRDDLRQIDPDISSQYKQAHDRGWRLSYRHEFRPWLDQRWEFSGLVGSNASLQINDRDFTQLQIDFRQLALPWDFALSGRWQHRFVDDHRTAASDHYQLGAQLNGELWPTQRWRLSWRVQLDHALKVNQTSLGAWIQVDFSQGRQLKDWREGEVNFKGIRHRELNRWMSNNALHTQIEED